jgi:hypothetical protein
MIRINSEPDFLSGRDLDQMGQEVFPYFLGLID